MIGCLRTCIRKQPIIGLYFEFETVLKFYNLGAWIKATTVLTHHQLGTGNGPQSSYLVLLCPYHVGGSMSRQAHPSVWINLQWPVSPSSPNAERQTHPTFMFNKPTIRFLHLSSGSDKTPFIIYLQKIPIDTTSRIFSKVYKTKA